MSGNGRLPLDARQVAVLRALVDREMEWSGGEFPEWRRREWSAVLASVTPEELSALQEVLVVPLRPPDEKR